ncbi:nuclear transport factor 2 (NTF2) superfamily protein [Gellertiella hungarica]|uniref:Nuclear transport factor 2 (NTF2) superfamily protein n=1 Tax=Gellertiella hungarica TaxID=1572859 RepID=A0A7W6JAN3_9HYPH|nr:nuclear transport factor 2 (NTF2) superfamily protein [Gellertiella hungarica]
MNAITSNPFVAACPLWRAGAWLRPFSNSTDEMTRPGLASRRGRIAADAPLTKDSNFRTDRTGIRLDDVPVKN